MQFVYFDFPSENSRTLHLFEFGFSVRCGIDRINLFGMWRVEFRLFGIGQENILMSRLL